MEVYALIGASGTGKSHNANKVLQKYHIEVMIDDGLLIQNGKKLAGTSAKAEATMVQAVKRAIFNDPVHAQEVKEEIQKINPQSILLIGTSEKMITRIANALDLPPAEHKIFIQEISSPEQIELAQKMRKDGKHVIPLPSIEVKKDLPNYWIDSIFSFVTKKKGGKSDEKSIVRPKFSQMGTLTITEAAIEQIVLHLLQQVEVFETTGKIQVEITDFGVNIYCDIKIKFGTRIRKTVEEFQKTLVETLENLTSLTVLKIDVRINGIFS
ncbi:MAG: Asp23/Gls24 family envelope stress response protein [Peptococcaceae bacterium]|nr:Asp23/Gls24 family envelope stress response protein [Peptococcaceae bacterium]